MEDNSKSTSTSNKSTERQMAIEWKIRIVIWLTIPLSILVSYFVYFTTTEFLNNEFVSGLFVGDIDVYLMIVFFFTFITSLFSLRIKKRYKLEISEDPLKSTKVHFKKNGLEIRFLISIVLFLIYYILNKTYYQSALIPVFLIVITALVYGLLSTYLASRIMMIPLYLMFHQKKIIGSSVLAVIAIVLLIFGSWLFFPKGGEASNLIYYFGEIEMIQVEAGEPMEFGTEIPNDLDAVITFTNGDIRTISISKLDLSEYNRYNLSYEYVEFDFRGYKGGFSINYFSEDVFIVDSDQQLALMYLETEYSSLYVDLSSLVVLSEVDIPQQFTDIYLVGNHGTASLLDIEILYPDFNLYISDVSIEGTINAFGRGNREITFYSSNHIAGSMIIESIVEIELTEDSYTTIRGIYQTETFIGDAITISGKGTLNIYGSQGINGVDGTETSKNGTDGTDGFTAIVAKEQLILNSYRLEFAGGYGGYGGNGYSYNALDDSTTTTRSGGDGGNGGNTAVAMEACSVSWVYEPRIFLDEGARGGFGGDKGNNVSTDGTDGLRGILNEIIYKPGTSYCN